MDYPNNFNIPSFSAGKSVAFSRGVSIWISIVFFLIVCACGFMIFIRHYQTNFPFLISINPYTDAWSVIAYPKQGREKIPQHQIIQEKLVRDYATNWFTISQQQQINELRWQKCSQSDCAEPTQFRPNTPKCAIYCKSSAPLFADFYERVLPQYRARVDQGGEKWAVNGMLITPQDVAMDSGKWQFYAVIDSNINGQFNVLGFVDINRDIEQYPATMGYYVQDFNAYRISDE